MSHRATKLYARCGYMASEPVKVLKTLHDRHSYNYILSKFHKSNKQANLSYHISIKKSQAILKCFIDLKFSVWFTLGSEKYETMFCDT